MPSTACSTATHPSPSGHRDEVDRAEDGAARLPADSSRDGEMTGGAGSQ